MDIKINEEKSGCTFKLVLTGMTQGKLSCLMNALTAYPSTLGKELTSEMWKALEKGEIKI